MLGLSHLFLSHSIDASNRGALNVHRFIGHWTSSAYVELVPYRAQNFYDLINVFVNFN